MADKDPDHFPPSSGRGAGWTGIAVMALAAVLLLSNGFQTGDLLGLTLLGLFAWIVWVAVVQTHATVEDETLVLHNAFHTARVPLASIEHAEVRMTLLLNLQGAAKPVSFAGFSRTRREISRNARPDPINNYPDLVVQRIEHLAGEARELGRQAGPVVREPAWLRIGVLIALVAASIAAALLT